MVKCLFFSQSHLAIPSINMSAYAEHEGKSLDDIIKANKKARVPNTQGPVRGGARQRDSPYSSSVCV
jgi:hypothetical protein